MSTINAPMDANAINVFPAPVRAANVPVVTPVSFAALDGFMLGGVLHEPTVSTIPPCAVVFNCGGGIPAVRYAGFATYLASQGIPVLAYDYRGIGASRPSRLRGYVATAEDWSELDCSGAIAWLRARYPKSELFGMAHSIGAMLFGGAANISQLSRLVFIGAHTGYFGDYRRLYRVPMAVLWHGLMPLLTHAFGYFPGRILRLGEDIPAGVAHQWASRRTAKLRAGSRRPGAMRTERLLSRYKDLHVPIYALSFADDAFATVKGAQRLLSMYPGVKARHDVLDPAKVGLGKIGHFGFFRRSNGAVLWPLLLPFLQSSSLAGSAPWDQVPVPGAPARRAEPQPENHIGRSG